MRGMPFARAFFVTLCLCAATIGQTQVIYVDAAAAGANDGSSWTNAHVQLQDALAAALAAPKPVEIRVAQGVYKPYQDAGVSLGYRDATFQLLNDVALRGGYAGATADDPGARDAERYPSILSGAEEGPPSWPYFVRNVVTASLTHATAILDGFTITGGRSGVQIKTGSPTVINCTFENNQVGIDCRTDKTLEVLDCYFIDNEDSGIQARYGNNIVTRCLFERTGLAIECSGNGTLAVTDSVFRQNSNGALGGSSSTDLLRCSFINNWGSWLSSVGAIVTCSGDLTARQCSLRSNTTRTGAATLSVLGNEATLLDCDFSDNTAPQAIVSAPALATSDVLTVKRCSFVGNSSSEPRAGVIESQANVTKLSNCVFTGNSCGLEGRGPVFGFGIALRVSNCTFADNRGQSNSIDGAWCDMILIQCIFAEGLQLLGSDRNTCSEDIAVTYCNVPGGYAGQGNIDVDPAFVRRGHWADPNDSSIELGPDDPQAIWVAGDYHLKSQAGHWDSESETWILDDVTSPCIDAGDPNGFLGAEPFPNGGYVNLGAYGGTREASRSYFGRPVCENQLAGDINGDCVVDQTDMDILLSHWLADATERANIPPSVTVTSPEEGAEFTYPDPIILRAQADDPDGRVVQVKYRLTVHLTYSVLSTGATSWDPTNGWEKEMGWTVLLPGDYEVSATALDNGGATGVSPPIRINILPSK